jgi:hypothetical protein
MFQRLSSAPWEDIAPVVGLLCAFIAFGLIIIKAIGMRKDKVDHLANLPLQDDDDAPQQKEKPHE